MTAPIQPSPPNKWTREHYPPINPESKPIEATAAKAKQKGRTIERQEKK